MDTVAVGLIIWILKRQK